MAGGIVLRERNIERRSKVKTGCATCRIRKVKCDESKPSCKRCVNTGRTCDGYESPFRLSTCPSTNNAHVSSRNSGVGLPPARSGLVQIAPQDVDLLNRYFSTKTLFDVELNCDEEARQVLQASLTDPSIRHAVQSLKSLREDLETSGGSPTSDTQQTPNYHHGLQQYNMALGGLVSNLSARGSNGLKSALLCCQIFISIEQVRKNYVAMAQHIIRGLRIMHEYRARPVLNTMDGLIPAHHDQLPFLDIFIIKMFAAPCKFAEPPASAEASGTTSPGCSLSPPQQLGESRDLRTLAPNMRTELTRIAIATLEFLGRVSQVQSAEIALRLLSEKAALLDSLDSWLGDLELVQTQNGFIRPETISESFLRIFYLILRIILMGALEPPSPGLDAELRIENNCLSEIADDVSEKLRTYKMCNGIGSK